MESEKKKLRERGKTFFKTAGALFVTIYAITFFLSGGKYILAVLFFGLSFILVGKAHLLIIELINILDILIQDGKEE